jgi:HD-GYP domain-containing protein (c-di-GMP phosphodiesterase class II)
MTQDTPTTPAAATALLQRCAALLGWSALIGADGAAVTAGVRAACDLLRTREVVDACRACPTPPTGWGLAPLFEGAWVAAARAGAGSGGRVCTLLLAPGALASPGLRALARSAGHDPAVVDAEVAPFARFDGPAARAVCAALSTWTSDLERCHQQAGELEDFTRNLSESYDTIELLYSLGRSIHNPAEPERFFELVADRLFATLNFGWLAVIMGSAPTPIALRGRVMTRGRPPVPPAQIRKAGTSLRTQGASASVEANVPGLSTPASPQILVQPILCKGGMVGLVLAGGKHGLDPMVSSYDLQLVEATSGYLSAFTENVALYEDQRSLFMGTLHALTAAIDAKDRYTCGHSERVACLAGAIARAMNLPPHDIERIELAGLVHDVGKIGVPEAVLTKPGKLTEAEFALIQLHPEVGHRILKDIPQLQDLLPGVLHHHERWDGRGYPHGLTAERIPHYARIIAVADTFDAMSSNRSYRPALAREQVLAEIERCAGTQLDPAIASLIRTISLREFDRLLAQHAITSSRSAA